MSGVCIRAATVDDIDALLVLVTRAYRGDTARIGWTHEADLLDGQRTDAPALAEVIADTARVILMAHDGDTLVGCVMVAGQADGSAYLGMLSVEPTLQAGGLGRILLDAAEAEAVRRFGASRMEMTVIPHRTELIRWYERRGYALTGATAAFPMEDERFGLPKRLDLSFVVLAKPLRPAE